MSPKNLMQLVLSSARVDLTLQEKSLAPLIRVNFPFIENSLLPIGSLAVQVSFKEIFVTELLDGGDEKGETKFVLMPYRKASSIQQYKRAKTVSLWFWASLGSQAVLYYVRIQSFANLPFGEGCLLQGNSSFSTTTVLLIIN